MAQTSINILMDEDLKRDFDALCDEMGLTMTSAFTVFAKAVAKKRAIPFEVPAGDAFTRKAAPTETIESVAGILHRYSNPSLIPCEAEAWQKAAKEKHAVD